jgi:hypothetical protein
MSYDEMLAARIRLALGHRRYKVHSSGLDPSRPRTALTFSRGIDSPAQQGLAFARSLPGK